MRTASDSFIKNLKDSIFSDNTLTNIFNKVTDLKKYQFFEYTENAEEFNKPVKKAVVNENVIEFDLNGDVLEPIKPPVSGDRPVFDSLPSKSTTPTMTYAGIGSRETPQEVLDVMTQAAKYLDDLGYTLNTGKTYPTSLNDYFIKTVHKGNRQAAEEAFKAKQAETERLTKLYGNKVGMDEEGADRAFSAGASKKNLFSPMDKISDREMKVGEEIHPNWSALSSGAAKLMARNSNQVFGAKLDTPIDFVIFYAKETTNPLRPAGGTGQAVEMARRKGIPTINMADTNWRDQLKTALANKPTQPPISAPIREELDGLSEAREAYKSLFIANKIPPITFTVGVSTWKLNKNFNYDLIDQDTGEVQLKNVNMVTGMIEEDAVEYTILTRKQLNDYIKDFEQKVITFNLEDLLAVYGIDIQDVYKRLNSATTTEDLIEIETEINRKLCQ